jgi:hypothetical protein
MFEQPRVSYAVMVLLFILPQSLFTIGDFMAAGIRFPLFRWQESGYGASIIPINKEIGYLSTGIIKWTTPAGGINPTALATLVWVAGLVVLLGAAAMVMSWHLFSNPDHARYPGPLLLLAGALFLAWGMVQYGPLLSGPTGSSIPVGVPVLWYCAWQFMQAGRREAE